MSNLYVCQVVDLRLSKGFQGSNPLTSLPVKEHIDKLWIPPFAEYGDERAKDGAIANLKAVIRSSCMLEGMEQHIRFKLHWMMAEELDFEPEYEPAKSLVAHKTWKL